MTIPHLFNNPIILEKGSKLKILGCLLQVLEVHNGWLLTIFKEDSFFLFFFFFCYTTSQASAWTFCWKSCSLKTLNNQVPFCTRSVQFYLCESACKCVCMGLFLLSGAPQITANKASVKFTSGLSTSHCCQDSGRGSVCFRKQTHAYMNTIYTACTDWSSQLATLVRF